MKALCALLIPVFCCGCSLGQNLSRSFFEGGNSLDSALKKYEEAVRQDVSREGSSLPSEKDFEIPADADRADVVQFFESYLALHHKIVASRNKKLVIRNMAEFESLWLDDWEEAQRQSSLQKKPLLVKIATKSCRPCRLQDRLSFREEKLFNELQNFVLLKIDGDALDFYEEGKNKKNPLNDYVKSLGLKNPGFPTVVLLSGSKKKILQGFDESWENYWGELFTFRSYP